jgi:hypothetical protein
MDKRLHISSFPWTVLAACGADEGPQDQTATGAASGDQQQVQAAAQAGPEEEAPMSDFLAATLHSIEPAEPGQFRLEVAGSTQALRPDGISDGYFHSRRCVGNARLPACRRQKGNLECRQTRARSAASPTETRSEHDCSEVHQADQAWRVLPFPS